MYLMSNAVTDDERWLEIRGPKLHFVRAALDPLGVERPADDMAHEGRKTQRTVPDVTAHPLVTTEAYLPSAYTGIIVVARDTHISTTLCHVRNVDGISEQPVVA